MQLKCMFFYIACYSVLTPAPGAVQFTPWPCSTTISRILREAFNHDW